MTETTPMFCYVHPERETRLRCKNCERPICVQCATRTPTGYSCKECVRNHQKKFDTAEWYDYLIGFGATAGLSMLTSILIAVIGGFLGFFMWFITIAIAGSAGVIIANATQAVLRRRRARTLYWATAAGVVIGALPVVLFQVLTGNLFALIWQGIYLFTATPTVYARLSGFQFRR